MTWGFVAGAAGTIIGGALTGDAARKAGNQASDSNAAAIAEQRRQYDLTRSDYAPYRSVGYGALAQLAQAYGIPGFDIPGGQQHDVSTPMQGEPTPWDNFTKYGISGIRRGAQVGPSVASVPSSSMLSGPGLTHDVTGDEVLQDPGYQFGMQQGQQALDRKAAAAGGRISGAALKSASRFSTDYGSTKYGEAYQRRQDRLNRLQALAGIGQTSTAGSAAAGASSANAISSLLNDTGSTRAGSTLAQGNIWGNTFNNLAALYGRQTAAPTQQYPWNTTGGWTGEH